MQATRRPARLSRRTRWGLGITGGLVAAAILATLGLADHTSSKAASEHRIGHEVDAFLAGIPQQGNTLGKRTAPVTLEVFADLEDPDSRGWFRVYFPAIVDDYVRTGDLELQYHSYKTNTYWPAIFVKQQTAALAAGAQGKLWNFIGVFYHEQGKERTRYVTEGYLDNIARQVPGLDIAQWHAARHTGRREEQTTAEDQRAKALGLHVTPSFRIGRTGGPMKNFVGRNFYRYPIQKHRIYLVEAGEIGKAIARLDPRR